MAGFKTWSQTVKKANTLIGNTKGKIDMLYR